MREPFLQRLERRVVVCDGAMGTMIYAQGVPFSRSFDGLNLSSPQLVKGIHLSYVKAGAEVIETNTFGANRYRLSKFGLAEKAREINLAGARLAREVAGEDLYVAGSVGPLGLRLEPLGPTSLEEARDAFREQIEALVAGGVDLIVIETMTDASEALQALLAAREVASGRAASAGGDPVPIVVQMTIQEDGSSATGARPADFARRMESAGANLVGVNCGVGPAPVLEALERMAAATSRRLSAQPNAGLPSSVQGRSIYLCSPEYMAEYARRSIEAGARLVGGCCGTTPAHIRAIRTAVRSLGAPPSRAAVRGAIETRTPAMEPVPLSQRSRLAATLLRNEFPVLVEIAPPRGCDPAREIEGAQYLLNQGVRYASVPDGSAAAARMSAQTLAALIERTGIETLVQYSCRDRNLLRIQSDLLGAHALGLRNILAVTGAPPPFGSDSGAAAPVDVDSIGLVNVLANLNRGLDVGSNPLGARAAFVIAVGMNPGAPNQEEQLRRYRYKVEAGADFAVTQPVFDVELLRSFLERAAQTGIRRIPVIASVVPLTSLRHAEFLANEVPGVSIPEPVIERMRSADTGNPARAEGVRIARETILALRGVAQGVHIAAPFGRYALALEVAQALTEPPTAAKWNPGTP